MGKPKKIESLQEDYPSDESFEDECFNSTDYTTELDSTTSKYTGYLISDPLQYNTQILNATDSSSCNRKNLSPPELPPRTGRKEISVLLRDDIGRSKVKKPAVKERQIPDIDPDIDSDIDSDYEDMYSLNGTGLKDSENTIPNYECPDGESVCNVPKAHDPLKFNLPPFQPRNRLPSRKQHPTDIVRGESLSSEWDDNLSYEIGSESQIEKPPTPPPLRPNVRMISEVPTDTSELIRPQKPFHPGLIKADVQDINQAKKQLKPAIKESSSKPEVPQVVPKPAKGVLKPAMEVLKPAKEVLKPAKEVLKPAKEVLKPAHPVKPPSQTINNSPKKIPILPPVPSSKVNNSLESKKWFQHISREESSSTLEAIKKNGAFIVRPSSKQADQPYTLAVYLDGNIRNIPLRKRSDDKFALGTSKLNELTFDSICDLISHHSKEKIEVTTANGIRGVTLVDIYMYK